MSSRNQKRTKPKRHFKKMPDRSKQTVLRLNSQLETSRFGKTVLNKKGLESYCSLNSKLKDLSRANLTPEGLKELALCRNFLSHILPAEMEKI
jgi:hypothetical protein